jgi:hypothetical protein
MDGVPCQSSFSRVTGVSDDIQISGSSKGHTRSAQQQEKKE